MVASTQTKISHEEGRILLKLARYTIADKLGLSGFSVNNIDISAPIFSEKLATFVTLKIVNNLRGCIGSLVAVDSLADGVKRNAVSAAFHDPRFAALSADEFAQIHISVSVLTPSRPLDHEGGDDLIKKITPGVDGLIIRRGAYSATFLPQVWEQLPQPEDFLSHLCHKAGLPLNGWQSPELEVSLYQALYFEESEPS